MVLTLSSLLEAARKAELDKIKVERVNSHEGVFHIHHYELYHPNLPRILKVYVTINEKNKNYGNVDIVGNHADYNKVGPSEIRALARQLKNELGITHIGGIRTGGSRGSLNDPLKSSTIIKISEEYLFESVSNNKQMWDELEAHDRNLPEKYKDAVDKWVGVDVNKEGNEMMIPSYLESMSNEVHAYNSKLRNVIAKYHGTHITAYRGTDPEMGQSSGRQNILFSWTTNKKAAHYFAGGMIGKPFIKVYSPKEIASYEKIISQKNKIKIGQYTYVKNQDGYVDKYDSYNSHIGDAESLTHHLNSHNEAAKEYNEKLSSNLKSSSARIEKRQIPIEDIVHATNRTGQEELIVRNSSDDIFQTKDLNKLSAHLSQKHGAHVELYPHHQGSIYLSTLIVPKHLRGKGVASNALKDVIHYAKIHKVKVVLNAEPLDDETKEKRLIDFYKSHGFVENKGRNRDLTVGGSQQKNTMYTRTEI